jgi:ubiquinone/menaquinone biosynthesis C-methylase UbiE
MNASTPLRGADLAPNHHADHPAFAGLGGLVAALTFSVGRRAAADLAIRLTDVGPDDDVLDVGCGPGVAVRRATACGASSVVGVDPAPVMLRVARALGSFRRRGTGVHYLEGTAEELPLADGCVSVLWSLSTVHHWRDLTGGLEEARRVLRTAGRLLAIERDVAPGASGHRSHGWTEAQAERFVDQCKAVGFTDVEVGHHGARHKLLLSVLARRP